MESTNTQTNKTFLDLGLSEKLTKAYNDLNFYIPTSVQQRSIPVGLQGKDLICQSNAGTGKTLAFLGVLFSKINCQEKTTQALIVLPTRELAFQVFDVLRRIAKKLVPGVPCESACFIGGIPIENDRNKLRDTGVHVVIGTPGRIKALLKEKALTLDHLKVFILDEADKLLDTHGFGEDVYNMMAKVKGKCQLLAFSATIEERTLENFNKYMHEPAVLYISKEEEAALVGNKKAKTGDMAIEEESKNNVDLNITNLKQYYAKVEGGTKGINLEKNLKVIDILKNVTFDQAIIFYNDKGLGEDLASDLREEGISLNFIHGDQTQAERIKIMNKFKLKKVNVLLSTDLLSRGIDVENIGLVINYDVPPSIETYFHRIGRTGRFGKYGVSIIFIRQKDEEFLFKNKNYFVSISELPQSYDEINVFLSNNKRVQAEKEEMIKSMMRQQGKKEVKPKTEYHYSADSEITRWQAPEHQFYDEHKFKYYEDPVELLKEGMQISDELDMYQNIVLKEQIAEPQQVSETQTLSADLEFLKCRHCYEIALQMQTNLNHKLDIIEYFSIDENFKH